MLWDVSMFFLRRVGKYKAGICTQHFLIIKIIMKKNRHFLLLLRTFSIFAFLFQVCSIVYLPAQDLLTPKQLAEEYQLIKEAYQSLHPGLLRHISEADLEAHFAELRQHLSQPMNRRNLYLTYSKFLAKIRDGHTYCNYWNQPNKVKEEVFYGQNKLPFTFRLIGKRMIVDKNASDTPELALGTEILSINGVTVETIIDSLLLVVKADGKGLHKQLNDIQTINTAKYESFDIFYPLFFPTEQDLFLISGRNLQTGEWFQVETEGMTRAQRDEALMAKYGEPEVNPEDSWEFKIINSLTGYLKLGSFITWKMEMNWKKFLREAFSELEEKNIPELIIDIRDNEGGAGEALIELSNYILQKNITLPEYQDRLVYQKVPESLKPYLTTWENRFFDISKKVKPDGQGAYTWKVSSKGKTVYKTSSKAYKGQITLLVNAANSSLTFILARIMKEHQLATVIGQETGGNKKGITGGMLFFMTLPYSGIEMDIPLIADYPLQQMPDEGVIPDIVVEPSVEDFFRGIDTELEAAINHIQHH